ncbi:MAG: carbohydrate ABC transporter permease [Cyanobacteriota bacterium]|jgi:multiple sugar transport system permease protein
MTTPWFSLVLMAPALLLMALLFVWPWLRYGWLSLHASSLLTGLSVVPNGGANWSRLARDGRFWVDALQTLRFAGVSVLLELGLGLLMALVLHRPSRGRGWLRALVLIPWALPGPVMALGWRWILNDPYGPINALIQRMGWPTVAFLATPSTTWFSTVVVDVWKTAPFVAIVLLAGLQSIPRDLEEALRLEGAGPWTLLRRLQWPLLAPYVTLAVLFRLAQAMGVFDLIQLLTGGGPAGSTESLALYAYLQAMRFLDFGYSATVMLASFFLMASLALLWLGWMRWQGARTR